MHVNSPADADRSPRKIPNFFSLLFESSLAREMTPVEPRDPSEWSRLRVEKYKMARENKTEKVCGMSVIAGNRWLDVAAWAMPSEKAKGKVHMHSFLKNVVMGASSLEGAMIASVVSAEQ
jgi:hypothetical protein